MKVKFITYDIVVFIDEKRKSYTKLSKRIIIDRNQLISIIKITKRLMVISNKFLFYSGINYTLFVKDEQIQ